VVGLSLHNESNLKRRYEVKHEGQHGCFTGQLKTGRSAEMFFMPVTKDIS
jgi:hypothetical protein